jgi:hypothetical protein
MPTNMCRLVMPALVAGIHVLIATIPKTWMAGTSPAMTPESVSTFAEFG